MGYNFANMAEAMGVHYFRLDNNDPQRAIFHTDVKVDGQLVRPGSEAYGRLVSEPQKIWKADWIIGHAIFTQQVSMSGRDENVRVVPGE